MKFNKIIALAAAGVLALSAVGCGKEEQGGTAEAVVTKVEVKKTTTKSSTAKKSSSSAKSGKNSSKKKSSSLGMGLAVLFVLILSSLVTWLLYNFVLVPFNVGFLSTIVFILVIATLVQFVEMVIKKYIPGLYKVLGIYLPLITTNCAIRSIGLIVCGSSVSLCNATVYSPR